MAEANMKDLCDELMQVFNKHGFEDADFSLRGETMALTVSGKRVGVLVHNGGI